MDLAFCPDGYAALAIEFAPACLGSRQQMGSQQVNLVPRQKNRGLRERSPLAVGC